jgi:DNA-binding NtrC family response regulator
MTPRALVVDEQAGRRRRLATLLEGAGYEVTESGDVNEGWRRFVEGEPDVVIADWTLPEVSGRALLVRVRERSDVPFIAIAEEASVQSAVMALKVGADDFVSCREPEIGSLLRRVAAALGTRRHGVDFDPVDYQLVGASLAMNKVRARVRAVAPLMTPVLIVGEAGSGRDAVARLLHEVGSTSGTDLTIVDCAKFRSGRGLPRARAVYLDGVESLEPSAQAFLADRLARVGRPPHDAEPRILASALPQIKRESGRSIDRRLRRLLLRFPVELPPLRRRSEDVPAIADALVQRLSKSMNRRTRLTSAAKRFLEQRHWPGNVRELEELLERAVAFCGDRLIRESLLVDLSRDFEESVETMRCKQGLDERESLVAALRESGGNVSHTARKLGRSRGAVYRMIERHRISLATPR